MNQFSEHSPSFEHHTVVISGGGPSGLFLALDLAHRGIASLVIEPRTEVDQLRPRAKTTNARTMTHLRRIGLAEALRKASPLPVSYSQDVAFCSRLNGYELTRFRNAFQLATGPYPLQPECGQQVPQPVVENVLRNAALNSDLITLQTGSRVTDVIKLDVTSEFGNPQYQVQSEDSDGTTNAVIADFVVGSDGGSSTVRKALGIPLQGDSAALSNISVLFTSRDLAEHIVLDDAVQYWVLAEGGSGMIGRMDLKNTWWAIIQGVDPDDRQIDVTAAIRSMAGSHVDINVLTTDPWTARMLLASSYGRDGIYLVGDAAHLNPPWGGHGFNTCIGDAANLAWKLGAVIHGWAPASLISSYEQERRPVAARTISDAAANGKSLACDFASPLLGHSGPEADAARAEIGRKLQVKASEFHALGLVLGYHYADSALTVPDGTRPPAEHPITYVPSASPGSLLPHAWIGEGQSLYDELGIGFTLLLDEQSAEITRGEHFVQQSIDTAKSLGIPLKVCRVDSNKLPQSARWGANAILVRPDQHISWRGNSLEQLPRAIQIGAGVIANSLV